MLIYIGMVYSLVCSERESIETLLKLKLKVLLIKRALSKEKSEVLRLVLFTLVPWAIRQ